MGAAVTAFKSTTWTYCGSDGVARIYIWVVGAEWCTEFNTAEFGRYICWKLFYYCIIIYLLLYT